MKKVIGIIFIMVISLMILTGCTSQSNTESKYRFVKIENWGDNFTFYDRETKVQYYFLKRGYGAGLTVLVDADGKPLLYEE